MSKILIVDDNIKNLQVLANTLADVGYEIEYAQNGQEALEVLKSDSFDIILMDVMMPVMNGFDACKQIKENDKYKEIPIIFLTAKTDEESISNGFMVGGVDYVAKPFNSKELLSRVKTHVELKQGRDSLKNMNTILEQKVNERTIELINANESLTKAKDKLSILDEAKNNFLRIISHELRTPLNGIMGILYLLKNKVDDKEIAELLSYMDISVKRLEKFSYQALKITQLQSEKYELEKSEISIGNIIDLCLIDLSEKIKAKNIEIVKSDNIHNITFSADVDLFALALNKIIENAIQHTFEGTVININAAIINSTLQIIIDDSGKGFDLKNIESTFDLFHMASDYHDTSAGIDMPLVKLITEKHNGNILIGNKTEGGATVKIIFNI